ncbi:SsgA family sporulation/cell division regulator [Streptomyces sp. NPDC048279]|uniref:SsgA family sporulation/cell division regulator n=1 Tax=Streptomyces sp. NPDC048279 TaxID=3154714 RepID=UPI00342430CA
MLTDIDHSVNARLCKSGSSAMTDIDLRYRHDDPLAARIVFTDPSTLDGSEVTWVFARDLLADGLHGPAGEGNVRIFPFGTEHIMIEFQEAQQTTILELAHTAVRNFLSRTYEAVMAGEEFGHLNMDSALAAFFDGDAGAR